MSCYESEQSPSGDSMPHFPTEWLRRTWDRLVARILRARAQGELPLPVAEEEPDLPPDDLGEVSALFRPQEGGRVRLTVEAFDAEPRVGGQVRLRLRMRNVGKDELPFGSLTLVWWEGESRDAPPLARQPALALPGTPPGGTAAFETRLPVPAKTEMAVTILLEASGGDGSAWAPEGGELVLARRVLAGVEAA